MARYAYIRLSVMEKISLARYLEYTVLQREISEVSSIPYILLLAVLGVIPHSQVVFTLCCGEKMIPRTIQGYFQ